MTVIDASLFSGLSGEPDLFVLRCHELADAVDLHVVVEARQTFQGAPKPLVFPSVLKRLKRFEHKIQYHAIDLPDSDVYPRAVGGRERFQRDALASCLPSGAPNDIVIISDGDEIPNGALIKKLRGVGWAVPIQLGQIPFYLWMNLRITSDISEAPGQRKLWNGSLLVRRNTLVSRTPYELRNIPGRPLVEHGGWHFSTLGGPKMLQEKLRSWGHPEKNQPPYNDLEHLKRCYREGLDWDVDRVPPMTLEWVEIDETYPAYVRENPGKFAQYMGIRQYRKGGVVEAVKA